MTEIHDKMDNYQQFIHSSRYARWLPDEQRRETWEETVDRYISFFESKFGNLSGRLQECREAILNLEVMPSMRCLMTAGKALERDNVAGFNCSYLPINHVRCFDELMYVLMCGTGVGFSVERQYVNSLPEVAEALYSTDTVIHVSDSKIGWASALRELLAMLYAGKIPNWDMSRVRPAGAPLKTFGGRASGPAPLDDLFRFAVRLFQNAAGRKLSSMECHDLVCKIADIVVVGGVRRSALISLSNLSDLRMATAKSGQWYNTEPWRMLANNSVCYTEKPDFSQFLTEWKTLYDSKSGERGIFNRVASQKQAARNGRRDSEVDFGTNPCSEIILRPFQFCNLSEVVVRAEDTLETLKRKVVTATILGTLQASLTNFRYLRPIWRRNTEEEALLGVSLTGIMDHPVLSGTSEYPEWELAQVLEELREAAVKTNEEWASKLGVSPSTALTCIKPSGTVSQLVDSASGIHSRYSEYYIRRVRADIKDPLAVAMQDAGYPHEPDRMKDTNLVFDFPVKAPEGAVCGGERSALEQLNLWKIYQDFWCEHKPSITVSYSDDEFMAIGAWVWENFDSISGISFLPREDHVYAQAPYEAISKDRYEEMVAAFPKIAFSSLSLNEKEDLTEGTQTMACTGNVCEMVDVGQ